MSPVEGKKTPLYEVHMAAGAKMVYFGGWLMPLQYTGILEEHRNVRGAAGLFDVSHMGEIAVRGGGAGALIQRLVTNDISVLEDGGVMYSPMCNEAGGVLDDLLVYRFSENSYMLVVNAANTKKDMEWIRYNNGGADIIDLSAETALVAVQGPRSPEILRSVASFDPGVLGYYRFREGYVAGADCIVSRTGYTGEDGFEIYVPAAEGVKVWEELAGAGAIYGLSPAGLGARDTLRFEASLPLYGHELDESTTPLEAGLGRFVRPGKGEFCGKGALLEQWRKGVPRLLAGLAMEERGIPRAGHSVFQGEAVAGKVTSGTYAPTLDANMAMAYLPPGTVEGSRVSVGIRGKKLGARVMTLPFYRRVKLNDSGRTSVQQGS
ncbi:MAG: glycine cleavage system aminomethyltransferase GcvT [Bacillota bacterium]